MLERHTNETPTHMQTKPTRHQLGSVLLFSGMLATATAFTLAYRAAPSTLDDFGQAAARRSH